MLFRVRFKIAGGHIHCSLFCAPAPNMTWAKCGDFVVRKGPEFEALLRVMGGVEFVGETQSDGIVEAALP